MLKTVSKLIKQEKEPYRIPRRVQDVIPIKRVWEDGIFKVGNKFTKSFKFTDINYYVSSREDKENMFLKYSELLNSLDSEATTKITIYNHKPGRNTMRDSVTIPLENDGLDKYREEYNDVMINKALAAKGIMQEKFITVSVFKKDIDEARSYFARIGADLSSHFASLGSKCTEMSAAERLKVLRAFYHGGEESDMDLDLRDMMRKGHDVKDSVSPSAFAKHSDYFEMDGKYGRVIYLKDYASYIRDDMITDLTDLNRNMMISIDVIPIPTDEAMREVENRLLGVETNITNWQRRQNANNNFSAVVPYDMELQRKESKEFLEDLTTRDQRMMLAVITLVHTADTKEQLDADTDTILSVARKHMCQMATLRYQQLDGLNTVLPIGARKINTFRTLVTESLAVFIPFKVQEIQEPGGIYFGENAISHNLILANMDNLQNQSMFILGIPGAGKSFFAKLHILILALSTKDDIIICDPEGEYSPLVNALKGQVVHIRAGGRDYINAMDMVEGYGDSNPIADKSQFIMSLIEQIDKNGVNANKKSIIDRCVGIIYNESKISGVKPTLCTLREKLMKQPEPEAQELALALELFTSGSLDIFAHETNVDTSNRIISYDIHELGNQLKAAGLLTITDAMLNRVTSNWKRGIRTHVFVDEFHVVFENEYSANFFNSAWRQFRKRNAFPVALTQNVEYLLASVTASTMLSNSEIIVMLNQAASDREQLGKLLSISPEQMNYVKNAASGSGLLRYGGALVPFSGHWNKDTEIYKLITTKAGEGAFSNGACV